MSKYSKKLENIREANMRLLEKKIIIESEDDDWGDSDKIGRAAAFEREGKKELYYVVDGKGHVKNISTTPMKAYGFLERNFSRLGGGQVKVKVVLKDDWDSEKINVGNIKSYSI